METVPDFTALEREILAFWEENDIPGKLRSKNSAGLPFRFLDGPITANNPMGIHHAWGRSLKDIALRYKAMRGFACQDRCGFDTQGLWVEVEVEKELGFTSKKDIEQYGLERFTCKCLERIETYARKITEQSKRLGQWMDWNNSYYTHSDENIGAIWYFLKKCHEKGWLSNTHRPLPWCPRCGTSLSEHEMAGSHKEITHSTVFARLPVKDRDFDILVWTTTPWTLAANSALAVHPGMEYVAVSVPESNRPLVLAKSTLSRLRSKPRILGSLTGCELAGLEYETFFPAFSVQQFRHTVILWEEVSDNEGSGVVHIAPGCGAEDYELGIRLGLPMPCPVDENGVFTDEYGFLSGLSADEANPLIFGELQRHNKLYAVEEYTHAYPVCWRCKHETLFRHVDGWVLKTDEIRPSLQKAAAEVQWEPPHIGLRMQDWLRNMGDWNISRKRFYGLPLPFYPCPACGKTTVVGSKEELVLLSGGAGASLSHLHRPWIDRVPIRCPHCGSNVYRIPEVGDVWLDAGIVPFSTLGYFSDSTGWSSRFPADWVTEMQEQVRLWFYSMLFMSVTLTGCPPYLSVLGYGSVLAEDGSKFSKTGNMIHFDEAADRAGADAIRYLFAGANPAGDVRFGYALTEEARRKILGLWNICLFFQTYADGNSPPADNSPASQADRWLFSCRNRFLRKIGSAYDDFRFSEAVRLIEEFIGEVSNWYIRTNRRRFWQRDSSALGSLYRTVKSLLQAVAPIIPFTADYLWQRIVRTYEPCESLSVHLSGFPEAGAEDPEALDQAETVQRIAALALRLRNERRIRVRQPLSRLLLVCDEKIAAAAETYRELLLTELNVKELVVLSDVKSLETETVQLDLRTAGGVLKSRLLSVLELFGRLNADETQSVLEAVRAGLPVRLPGMDAELDPSLFRLVRKSDGQIASVRDGDLTVALDTLLTPELTEEGLYRDFLRQCQVLRKESGFRMDERIKLRFYSESEQIGSMVRKYLSSLKHELLADELLVEHTPMRPGRSVAVENGDALVHLLPSDGKKG